MQTIMHDRKWWNSVESNRTASRSALWTGRIFGGLASALLAVDDISKVLELDSVVTATMHLGYSADVVFSLGITLLGCVATVAALVWAGLILPDARLRVFVPWSAWSRS